MYYLLDPITQRVRYVGCSFRPFERFRRGHLDGRSETHKARWIRKLLREGLRPILEIKCILQTEEEAFRVEIALIARLKTHGEQLTNNTAGGGGVMDPSSESRARQSESQRKRYEDPVEREFTGLLTKLAARG